MPHSIWSPVKQITHSHTLEVAMATAGGAIAELYITRRTYKERMKKMEKIEASAGKSEADHDQAASKTTSTTGNKHKGKNSSGGFFSGRRIFKKVHSNTDVPSSDTAVQ